MEMTDKQILDAYRDAKDQKEQVTILAELNAVGVWEMVTWLKEHGTNINLQHFQKYNPKWRQATSGCESKEKQKPSEKQDAPTREQYEETLRGIVALREELNRVKAELQQERRASSEGEQELSTAEQKLNRIKTILTTFYEASGYDDSTVLMVIDTLAREGDE